MVKCRPTNTIRKKKVSDKSVTFGNMSPSGFTDDSMPFAMTFDQSALEHRFDTVTNLNVFFRSGDLYIQNKKTK